MLAAFLILACVQDIEHVVLVSVDGLRPDFYLGDFEAPTLKALAAEGAAARSVESVYPSSTYPAHATIATGVRPARHGIHANTLWTESGGSRDWHWHAKDLKARTLWEAAKDKGLRVAVNYWPTSVGAKVDYLLGEIWDPDGKETLQRLTASATPGLLPELGLAIGMPEQVSDRAAIDRFIARSAAFVFRRYKPNLLMLHLLNVDEVQHKEGPGSDAAREALKAQDANLAHLRRAIAESGLGAKTLLIVTGDHGFTTIEANLNPMAALRDAGFLTVEDGKVTSWRANLRSSGGSAAVYVKDPADVPAVRKALLAESVHEGKTLFELLDRPALDLLGYNPDAAFAIEPAPGWAIVGSLAPRTIMGSKPTVKGNHGQLPTRPGLSTGFLMAGPGVPAGTLIEKMSLVDVAPTVAKALGLEMPGAEGRQLITK